MAAAQPDHLVQKELFGLLKQMSKFMVLYGSAAKAATTVGRGRGSLDPSRGRERYAVTILSDCLHP